MIRNSGEGDHASPAANGAGDLGPVLVLLQLPLVAEDRPLAPPSGLQIDPRRAELLLQLLRPVRLTLAKVNAPKINCVFNAACTVTVTDSVGNIPMPADVTGTGRVQSRTFAAAAGTPGAGNTAYLYRVDMTQAVSAGEVPCVTDFTIDFGPIVKLQYDGSGPLDDIFVIVQGGLGLDRNFRRDQDRQQHHLHLRSAGVRRADAGLRQDDLFLRARFRQRTEIGDRQGRLAGAVAALRRRPCAEPLIRRFDIAM